MPRILGISGSLRRASFNTSLLRAAIEVAPVGTTIEIGSIAEFPLYNADVEAAGVPSPVQILKAQLAAADGWLIATPEYNNSIPGVAKNAIDWLSRPPSDVPRLFRNKPIAIMGATPGQGGTILSQAAWLPILATLGTSPWFGSRLRVSGAGKVFDADGKLVDDAIREQLRKFVEGFAAYCSTRST
ncbi:MAG TPA: NADPH-dependent FMN reductase [Vicinamibacterales bacterium]|nr:NADPH-dependent FMN reductase [Vicinamibacterales bacterium]